MSYNTESPVVFCIFNRPDTTQKVFEAIRQARPPALYVVADGPRSNKPNEAQLCEATRNITKQIDWPCKVTYDFSDKNLGCKQRIYTGISKAFESFEFAIILEDDCLPSLDFFRFVDLARVRYDDDKNVMHISGTGLVRPYAPKQAYYRGNIPLIWGWATWKYAWTGLDLDMANWPELSTRLKDELYGDEKTITRFIKHLGKSYVNSDYDGNISTWDYPYFAHILQMKGHCITPLYNLVSNIGFGTGSTHTNNSNSPQASIPLDALPEEIIPPEEPCIDPKYSSLQLNNLLYRPKKSTRRFYRFCNKLGLRILPKLHRPKH
ncbi:hypothetical protein ACWPKO_12055 [Coraliomargarita sp. W4R53]